MSPVPSPRRAMTLLIVAALCLPATLSFAAAPLAAPALAVSPTSGPAGTTVTVFASGFTPNPAGAVKWDGVVQETFAVSTASFTRPFTIPAGASPGTHVITVCANCGGVEFEESASASFVVVATPTHTPEVRVPSLTPARERIVTRTPTPTPEPTACDARGGTGEVVIDFDGYSSGTDLRGTTTPEGARFLGDSGMIIVSPSVATHSGTKALALNYPEEFGSTGTPMRIGFTNLQDFVGVYVGLNEQIWTETAVTATLTGYALDADGHRVIAGSDSVSFGPEASPIMECLSVEAPGIAEVAIDYGGAAEPEVIDDLVLRGPEVPVPIPEDDRPPEVTILQPVEGALVSEPYVRLQGEVREDRELVRMNYQLRPGVFHDLVFTPAGITPEGDWLYLFAVDPLPASELTQCGENTVQVRAFDSSDNMGGDDRTFRLMSGDLSITAADAVQVVYDAPLVMGKGTAFRVRLNTTFVCPLEVRLRLDLPEDQWSTLPPTTGRLIPGIPVGWRYPEEWGPVPLPAGPRDVEVVLPYIPPGQEQASFDFSTHPYGLIQGAYAGGVYGPDVRVVPRPSADRASFTVEVDPGHEFAETDEGNNRLTPPAYEVVTTRSWDFLFVPTRSLPPSTTCVVQEGDTLDTIAARSGASAQDIEDYNNAYNADFDGDLVAGDNILIPHPLCSPELAAIEEGAKRQMEYLLATFPIADSKITWSFPVLQTEPCGDQTCGYARTWQQDPNRGVAEDSCAVMGLVHRQALEDNDFGVLQTCWGGQSCGGYAIWAGAYDSGELLAHEFNHSAVPMDDIYSLDCYSSWAETYCELPDGERFYCCYQLYSEEKEDKEAAGIDPGLGCLVNCGESDADCRAVAAGCPGASDCSRCCWDLCETECAARGGTRYWAPDGRTQVNMPAADGFWVNRWEPISGRTYFMDGPSGNNWMILESAVEIGALEGRDPACGLGGADTDGYLNLLRTFRDARDPEALLVSGRINRVTGTAVLDPFLRLPAARLDIEPGVEGDYSFVLLDEGGVVLSQSGFTPRFYRSDPNGGLIDETGFAFRIEWVEGTASIELRDRGGRALAWRVVSPNTPDVKVISPNGGEVWRIGVGHTVTWEAKDRDGDTLTYTLALSEDGGESWRPVAIDVTETKYRIDTSGLAEGETLLVRVRATDGVNTAEDVSDGIFAVRERIGLPVGFLAGAGLAALGFVGVALVLWALLSGRRRNA